MRNKMIIIAIVFFSENLFANGGKYKEREFVGRGEVVVEIPPEEEELPDLAEIPTPESMPASLPTETEYEEVKAISPDVPAVKNEESTSQPACVAPTSFSCRNFELGLGLTTTGVFVGNSSAGAMFFGEEANISFEMLLFDALHLYLELGPGLVYGMYFSNLGSLGPTMRFMLAEFAGVEYRLSGASFIFGARHRTVFWAEGADLNALFAEFSVRFNAPFGSDGLHNSLYLSAGPAWFVKNSKPKLLYPAGYSPPVYRSYDVGVSCALGLRIWYTL